MFFGLNKILKYLLPKRLFYRALIIVAAPTIILQLIIAVVFYDIFWIKVNKNITKYNDLALVILMNIFNIFVKIYNCLQC